MTYKDLHQLIISMQRASSNWYSNCLHSNRKGKALMLIKSYYQDCIDSGMTLAEYDIKRHLKMLIRLAVLVRGVDKTHPPRKQPQAIIPHRYRTKSAEVVLRFMQARLTRFNIKDYNGLLRFIKVENYYTLSCDFFKQNIYSKLVSFLNKESPLRYLDDDGFDLDKFEQILSEKAVFLDSGHFGSAYKYNACVIKLSHYDGYKNMLKLEMSNSDRTSRLWNQCYQSIYNGYFSYLASAYGRYDVILITPFIEDNIQLNTYEKQRLIREFFCEYRRSTGRMIIDYHVGNFKFIEIDDKRYALPIDFDESYDQRSRRKSAASQTLQDDYGLEINQANWFYAGR